MTRTDEDESKESLKEPILNEKCEEINDKEDWTTSQSSIVKVMVLIFYIEIVYIRFVTPYKSSSKPNKGPINVWTNGLPYEIYWTYHCLQFGQL